MATDAQKRAEQERREAQRRVNSYTKQIKALTTAHQTCRPYTDWHSVFTTPPPDFTEEGGVRFAKAQDKLENYKPGLLARKFAKLEEMKKQQLTKSIGKAYLKDVAEHERWQTQHDQAEKVIALDPDTLYSLIDEKKLFKPISDIGGRATATIATGGEITIDFFPNADKNVPLEECSLTPTGKLSVKKLKQSAYSDLIADFICSWMIRIARDFFALFPADRILINATETLFDSSTGIRTEGCLFSSFIERRAIESANMQFLDPSDFITAQCKTETKYTRAGSTLRSITPLTYVPSPQPVIRAAVPKVEKPKPVATPAPQRFNTSHICTSCGFMSPSDSKFCMSCGQSLGGAANGTV